MTPCITRYIQEVQCQPARWDGLALTRLLNRNRLGFRREQNRRVPSSGAPRNGVSAPVEGVTKGPRSGRMRAARPWRVAAARWDGSHASHLVGERGEREDLRARRGRARRSGERDGAGVLAAKRAHRRASGPGPVRPRRHEEACRTEAEPGEGAMDPSGASEREGYSHPGWTGNGRPVPSRRSGLGFGATGTVDGSGTSPGARCGGGGARIRGTDRDEAG